MNANDVGFLPWKSYPVCIPDGHPFVVASARATARRPSIDAAIATGTDCLFHEQWIKLPIYWEEKIRSILDSLVKNAYRKPIERLEDVSPQASWGPVRVPPYFSDNKEIASGSTWLSQKHGGRKFEEKDFRVEQTEVAWQGHRWYQNEL